MPMKRMEVTSFEKPSMVFFRSPVTKSHTLITLSAGAGQAPPVTFPTDAEDVMRMALKGLHDFSGGQVQNFDKSIRGTGGQVFSVG